MQIKLILGVEERLMSTDNGIPRIGDTIEFKPGISAKVSSVAWDLITDYTSGYITHQARIVLTPIKKEEKLNDS